jgi:3'(2'), 5'-bisphosphate nucleotidase
VAELAVRAGAAIMEIYRRDFEIEVKADNSPLTEADLAANSVICSGLRALSDLPILSEESRQTDYSERSGWSRFWLVDPLDGTKEFVKRNGEFTVNIALVEDGVPVAGFVYAPVLGKLFLGIAGIGAFSVAVPVSEDFPQVVDYARLPPEWLRLPCCRKEDPDVLRVVASRSHRTPETDALIGELAAGYARTELVSSGSSLKLCLVAEGKADVYPRLAPTMEWDTGAAQAVVEAAGKSCCAYPAGTPLRYNKADLLNPHFVVR